MAATLARRNLRQSGMTLERVHLGEGVGREASDFDRVVLLKEGGWFWRFFEGNCVKEGVFEIGKENKVWKGI